MKSSKILINCVKYALVGATGAWLASCGGVAPTSPVAEAPSYSLPSNPVFLGGGTIGNNRSIKGIPSNGKVKNTPTSGLRSGDTAITRDSINFFLNNPTRTVTKPFKKGATSKASQRPGLATGQGRSISSGVQFAKFKRAASKPKGVSAIYYNDKEGIEAVAGPWKRKVSGLQPAANGLVEWGVRSGYRYLKNYQSKGKRFVRGSKGGNYELVVKNKCHSRLELVMSVDGLSILNAQPASYRQRGYIIQPEETLVIRGFRTSQKAVAAFKFSDVNSSYVNQLGGATRNVGVIGLAVFTEKGVSPWRWSPKIVSERLNAEAF